MTKPEPNSTHTHTHVGMRCMWCRVEKNRKKEWESEWKKMVFYLLLLLAVLCVFFLRVWVFYFSQLDSGSKQLTLWLFLFLSLCLSSIPPFFSTLSVWMNWWMNEFVQKNTKRAKRKSHIGTANDRKLQLHNEKHSCFGNYNNINNKIVTIFFFNNIVHC